MITLLGTPRVTCDGLTRRETLRVGALSLLGGFFNLASVRAIEGRRASVRARNVILLYLQGGPATQDMFDLKPDAPSGIRSEFRPIATSAPGLTVCEHLPRTARWMHRAVVVRTVHHGGGCHNNLPMYTGFDVPPPDIDSSRPTDPPSMGSVCAHLLREPAGPVPPYVFLPCPLGWGEFKKKPGPHGGFLGQRYDPFTTECTAYLDRRETPITDMQPVRGEPILPGTELRDGLTIDALSARRGLLGQLDDQMRRLDRVPAVSNFDERQRFAFELLTSAPVRAAFDLRQETDPVRDRYGRTLFGASTLLARRLVERGARFVNVSWDNYRERFGATNQVWDTHERNFPIPRDNHLPQLDQTYSALMEDLDQRGLLDETLVVMMGEMGRTPRINANGGRDHWTSCYSVVLAGAGVRGGSAYGESDAHAAYVRDRPAHIRDLCATIYTCLGIDPDTPLYDHGRRPIPIAHGGRCLSDILK
jgi:hypothetical protein